MISGEEKPLQIRIPEAKCKNPVESINTLYAPFLIAVHYYLGVWPGFKYMAPRLKIFPQLDKIVNLTVENQMKTSVFIGNGLGTALDIDYTEASVTQSDSPRDETPRPIRPAMLHQRCHLIEQLSIRGRSLKAINSTNAAHFNLNLYFLLIPKAWFS